MLTHDHSVRAVPLVVLLALPHITGAGLGLVAAQCLPLPLQTVLVLQVVLHVRLEDKRGEQSATIWNNQRQPPLRKKR